MARKNIFSEKEIYDQILTVKKRQSYKVKETGKTEKYDFYLATWEVPKGLLPDGAPRKRITASDRREERAKAALVAKVTSFLDEPETHWNRVKARGLSLDGYVRRWAEGFLANDDISETQKRRILENYRNHISPYLGKKLVTQITDLHIQELINTTLFKRRKIASRIHKSGFREIEGMSASTRKNIYMTLSKIFSQIMYEDLISKNPMEGVKKPKITKTHENIDELINAIPKIMNKLERERNPDFARMFLQLLGLRRAERLALSWDDVNLSKKNPHIIINNQLARHEVPDYEYDFRSKRHKDDHSWYLKDCTKNGIGREIPLPKKFADVLREYRKLWLTYEKKWNENRDEQLEALEKWKAECEKIKRSESLKKIFPPKPVVLPPVGFENQLFLKPNGELITLNRDNEDWQNILKSHKLKKTYRGHLMRHAAATMLADSESVNSELIITGVLGQETTAMAYYYARIRSQHIKKALGQVSKSLGYYD